MNAFSDSLALRQMRMTTPAARKVGHPMKPTNGTCRLLVMSCSAIRTGMRTAAVEADATAVVDGAGVDVGGLPLHGDEQPRHGVDEDHHTAGDGEQHEADADPHDVHAGRPRHGAADPTEHPVVRGAAQGAQPPPDMVLVGGGAPSTTGARAAVRPVPAFELHEAARPAVAAGAARARGAASRTAPSGCRRRSADACRDRVALRYPDDRAPWAGGYQGHP